MVNNFIQNVINEWKRVVIFINVINKCLSFSIFLILTMMGDTHFKIFMNMLNITSKNLFNFYLFLGKFEVHSLKPLP
jgi:hypothetical protein